MAWRTGKGDAKNPSPNNLPALLAWNPGARRALFRSHSLAPLRPDLGSPMLAQTSQVGTVTRNWARAYWIRRRIIGWGSVVRIQRVWRKSLPVIRRKEDIFRSRDRKISCSQNHVLRGCTFGGFETKDLRQTLAVIQSHLQVCKVSNRLSATWPNFA